MLRKLFDRLDSESELDAFARSIDGLSKGRPPQSITQTIQKIVDFGLPLFHQSQGVSEIWRWPNDPRVDELDLGAYRAPARAVRAAIAEQVDSLARAIAARGVVDTDWNPDNLLFR